jgi:hypothetical protein
MHLVLRLSIAEPEPRVGWVIRFLHEPCAAATGGYQRSGFMIRVLATANRSDLLALQPIGQ